MIILNLTIPPLLVIMLTPSVLSNVSMPAPNASAIAAFSASGAPLPAFASGGRIYVLQDGAPAYVEYVPAFANSSGVYELSLSLDQPAVVVIPPGIMPQGMPQYRLIVVNKTGTYVEVGPGDVQISYYAMSLQLAPATQTAIAPQTSSTQSAAPPSASQTSAGAPIAQTSAFQIPAWALAVVVIVIIVAAVLLFKRR